jgi:hypothetical protein
MVSSPKKETSGKKVPKSGIFKGVKVFTPWSSIRRGLNHPKSGSFFSFLCDGTFRVLCSNNPSIGFSEWQRNLRLCLKRIVCATNMFVSCLIA